MSLWIFLVAFVYKFYERAAERSQVIFSQNQNDNV